MILKGVYKVYPLGPNTYNIYAIDAIGNPERASSTVANGGTISVLNSTNGSAVITVTLANHGYEIGSTATFLVPVTIGGLTIYGNYTVQSVPSSSTYTITASNQASATSTVTINGGQVRFLYYNGIGPLPQGTGFGVGYYGEGGYGTGVPPIANVGTQITATDWTLDNWGETFLSNPTDGGIYTWTPSQNDVIATIIPEAPPVNRGMFVAMPQRQIVAYGSTFNGIQDPLLIRWCDVNNYNVWLAQVVNQAGSYRLPKGSGIIGAIQGPQQGLIWTDIALWAMQYVGGDLVYGFNEISTGCGLIAKKAMGLLNNQVYWMSQSQFFRLTGGGVEPIFCPVWDVIFQDLDLNNLDKIRCAPNSRFGEISWYYPTIDSNGEVAKYVKYNSALDVWDFGTLARTAWINQSVLGAPIGAGTDRYIYQHETSLNADTQPMNSWFQTGYMVISDADVKMFIDQLWPDMKWGLYDGVANVTVKVTFYAVDYPGQTPYVYGPYSVTKNTTFITPRFRGRLVSIRVESDDFNTFWRIGNMRYRFQPDGKF